MSANPNGPGRSGRRQLRGLSERIGVEVAGGDRASLGRELADQFPPHARAAPGDDRDLPAKRVHPPTLILAVLAGYSGSDSRQRSVIGSRRSRPKFLGLIFGPGGYWRRLYSARSTSLITRATSSGSCPAPIRSAEPMSFST